MLNIMTEVRLQITSNMRQAPSSSVCLPHTCTRTHTIRRCTCTQKQTLNAGHEAPARSFTHSRGANVHSVKACRTRRRFAVVKFSCTHTQSKPHTQTQAQVRESRWRRNWQASFHCAPTIQQAFLYHTANMLSPSHTHSPLLFLSPLQSSIILSPHRHCRQ